MNLAYGVLVGRTAGILVGLLFGSSCEVLRPIGSAYVMLLEAAVYPYLICSLLHGLGNLDPTKAWRFFKRGWVFHVAAWAVTLVSLSMLAKAIPNVRASVIGSGPQQSPTLSGLLGVFIPSDLFAALSHNYVPAVVIFCIFYGVAIQSIRDKDPLLSILEAIRLASLRFWNWIVWLAPVAVFALFAVTAGTTTVHDALNLSLYLGLFLLGTLLLAFWVLPALIAALAPVSHREFLSELRSAIAIAAVTTLSVTALPFITEAARKLAERCGVDAEERDDIIRTNLSVAYPLGQLGNFFIYLFLVFAAYYYKVPLEGRDQALLPLLTLLSGFGSPTSAVSAVSFLSAWLPLPSAVPDLYVEPQTITRYGQVIVSVVAFASLSVLVTLSYYGKLRLRDGRFVMALLLPALVLAIIAWAGPQAHGYFASAATTYRPLALDPAALGRSGPRSTATLPNTTGAATPLSSRRLRVPQPAISTWRGCCASATTPRSCRSVTSMTLAIWWDSMSRKPIPGLGR
jgi:proton glutamate symport protein